MDRRCVAAQPAPGVATFVPPYGVARGLARGAHAGTGRARYRLHPYGLPPFTGANPTAFYGLGTVTHAPDLRAEVANAYELGYRGQLGPGLLFDAAAFSQHYRRMRSVSYAGFPAGLRRRTGPGSPIT